MEFEPEGGSYGHLWGCRQAGWRLALGAVGPIALRNIICDKQTYRGHAKPWNGSFDDRNVKNGVKIIKNHQKWAILMKIGQNLNNPPKMAYFCKTSGKSKRLCLGPFSVSPGGAREKLKKCQKTIKMTPKMAFLKKKWSFLMNFIKMAVHFMTGAIFCPFLSKMSSNLRTLIRKKRTFW